MILRVKLLPSSNTSSPKETDSWTFARYVRRNTTQVSGDHLVRLNLIAFFTMAVTVDRPDSISFGKYRLILQAEEMDQR